MKPSLCRGLAIVVVTLFTALSGACSKPRPIRVGAKTLTEQAILSEIVAQHLEKKVASPLERRFALGDTMLTHQALQAGEIDLYPEYTGIALTAILKGDAITEPSILLERCRQEYRQRMAAEWMEPLGFDASLSVIVRNSDAERQKIVTISDAATGPDPWRLGVTFEFQTREGGLGVLNRNYKMSWKGAARAADLSLLYQSLQQKSIDMIGARATDGYLEGTDTKVLKDDKAAFLPLQGAIVVRQDSLVAFPGLREALSQLSGKIDTQAMRRLNAEVDVKKRLPAEVAAEWLKSAGL